MKLCKILGGLFLVICLCGCDEIFVSINNSYEDKKTFNLDAGKEYAFVQANLTDEDIDASKTAKILSATPRSLGNNEELENTKYILPDNITDGELTHRLIQESMNRGITSAGRAVSSDKSYNPDVGDKSIKLYYYQENSIVTAENAKKVANGKYCVVYFIDDTVLVKETDIDFEALAEKFDALYEIETSIFGGINYNSSYSNVIDSPAEKDGAPKVMIIVADIEDKATENKNSGVFGYFSPTDFYVGFTDDNDKWLDYNEIGSNRYPSIYLDSYFYKKNQTAIYSTIAHEFNHLLNYVNKALKHNLRMETWYTEMLSAIAEDCFYSYLGVSPEQSVYSQRLIFFNSYYNLGFGTWRNTTTTYYPNGSDVYISYGNAFAFGAYLMRAYCNNDFKLLKQIATNEYVNEDSISMALKSCGFNKSFNDVLLEMHKIFLCKSLNNEVVYSANNKIFFPKIDVTKYWLSFENLCLIRSSWNPRIDNQMILGKYGFNYSTIDEDDSEKYSSFTAVVPDNIKAELFTLE